MILIRVYDGNTFARLLVESGPPNALQVLSGTVLHGLHRQVDKTWWPTPPQAVAQDGRVKEAIRTLIDQGLAAKLPGLL